MPRGMGASSGVNDTVGRVPVASPSACSISGVCRCTPPTWYGDIAPITSVASRPGRGVRPAPEVPDADTATMSAGSASPAASSGARARMTAVAWQPGAATWRAARIRSRAPGSSGRPYTQRPACGPE